MRCTLPKEQLLEPVVRAEKTTGKNHTLPILSCVLLTVESDTLTVTATNLEVGVRYTIPAQETQNGSVAVSGHVLSQIIATLPNGSSVTLEASNGHLSIQGAGSQSKIALQNKEEFPTLPTVENGEVFSIPAKALTDGITSVAYCASTSAIKPELSSVYLHPDGSALITAATDSFRLAEKKVPLKKPISANPFLIPARSVSDVVKFLEIGTDDVQIASNDHQLSLTTPHAYITLRLTAGTFPDYTQIIPKTFITEATILRLDFEHVLRRAAVFADQFNQTTLTIAPKKKQCTIHTQHTSVGETTDTIAAVLTGEEISIKFNQRYLLDALHPIATDSITLQCSGQAQPAVIRPVGDTTFLYLVMPMNR